MQEEIENIKDQLKEMDEKRNSFNQNFHKSLTDFNSKITEEFNKEKSLRKKFEQNIFNILEDTCVRLRENFEESN